MTPTKKHFFSTIFFLLLCAVQNIAQDSLGLKQAKNNLEKAIILRENIDSCLKYGDLVLKYYREVNKFESAEVGRIFHLYGVVYATKGRLSEAKENYFKSIEVNKKVFGSNHIQIARSYQNIGVVFNIERDFSESDKYHQQALKIAKLYPGKEDVFQATCLTNLAINSNAKGLYKQAIDYNLQGLGILSKYPNEGISIAGAYTNISNAHGFMGEYDDAINYTLKAIEIKQKLQPNSSSLARSYSNLSEWYVASKQNTLAEYYARQSLIIRVKVFGERHQDVATSYNNLGLSLLENTRYDSAELLLKKAIDIRSEMLSPNHIRTVVSKLNLAKCLSKQKNKRSEALSLLKEAAKQFITRTDYLDNEVANNINSLIETYFYIDALPEADSILVAFEKSIGDRYSFGGVYASPLYFNIHEFHAWVLRELYFKDKGLKYLLRSKDAYVKIDSIYEENKLEFQFAEYPDYLFEKIANNAKNLTYNNLLLFKATGEGRYLTDAFNMSEKYRSRMLSEHLDEVNLKQLFQVNSNYLQSEQQIDDEMAKLLKEVHREEWVNQVINPQKIVFYQRQIETLKRQKQVLNQKIANEYPEYIKLKYGSTLQTINSVQESLVDQNQAIIEYVSVPKNLCIITITKNTLNGELIPIDSVTDQHFSKLRSGLIDYFTNENPTDSMLSHGIEDFVESSNALYQILIKPIESQLVKIKKLTIIPDGTMVGIPFEVLLDSKPAPSDLFGAYPYLLKKFVVNYAYSANILGAFTQRLPKEKKLNTFLGFAPFYYGDTLEYAQKYTTRESRKSEIPDTLRHSAEEIFSAKRGWSGKIFVGTDATKKQFLNEANKYKIIHLSTHARANNKNGEFSYLHFAHTRDTLDEEKLYAQEVYNLNLNAELVVLSACEAGIGEYSIKDGVIGLAHAFSFAGTKSVVSTLWKVKEKHTKELLSVFYSKIKSITALSISKSVSEALYEAKLEMLKVKSRAHPFFWAGFIVMGDIKVLEQ